VAVRGGAGLKRECMPGGGASRAGRQGHREKGMAGMGVIVHDIHVTECIEKLAGRLITTTAVG